jgi:hypothetical protein rflaF_12134
MIVLKILLIILLVVLGIILFVFIVPMGGELSFINGKLKYKVNVWIINIMDSDGGGVFGWLKRMKSRKRTKKAGKKSRSSGESTYKELETPDNHSGEIPETETAEISQSEELAAAGESAEAASDEAENVPEAEINETDNEFAEEASPKSKKKKEKKVKKSVGSDGEKGSFEEKINKLLDIWNSAKRPACKIFKGFRFSDLYVDFVIANEDAYKCALNYGRISAAFYRILAQMSRLFTVRLKTVDIQPGFGLSKSRWDVSFRLNLRLGTFVIAGIWFLITYIFRVFLPNKFKRKKQK